MEKLQYTITSSPLGHILIVANDEALVSVDFMEQSQPPTGMTRNDTHRLLTRAKRELEQYFNGERSEFTVPIEIKGTEFQVNSWDYLATIPYGETRSYYDEAKRIGNEQAVRAVAMANHANKLAIVIPCHRIINKSGELGGYGGGLWRKKWLLEHERKHKSC